MFLSTISFKSRIALNFILCLFWKTSFGILTHTICLTYHFINKLFVKIPTNEPSINFYKSEIAFIQKSICWNTLLPQILGEQLYIEALPEGSGQQIERYLVEFKKIYNFHFEIDESIPCH